MSDIARAAAFAAFTLFAALPARAQDCGPLQRLASVDTIPTQGGMQMVPVTINGAAKKLLLDTAGGRSTLSASAIDALGLHPLAADRTRLLDRAGNASQNYVSVESFTIGAMQGKDIQFMVSPNKQLGTNPNLPIDGTMAGDLMERTDVEMDFAAGKLNYFSPDHCDGRVVYWPAAATAVVAFQTARPGTANIRDTHVRVPVTLDGHKFWAVINTGAARSTMSANTAKIGFNLTADSPGTVPLGTMGGDPAHKVFGYVFGNLAFDGIGVANPHIAIVPDLIGANDPQNGFRTGSLIKREDDDIGPEITIGMDVLKKLHLYFAFQERKLYITAAAAATDSSKAN